eukprot:CAMPEP_0195141672 /NCGR_PEP_ID=MMETSP0448-20130528/163368_1 /TAXON_ID=66468 /ORGANISM="Heterocapsa triquestra, Strain CCMP 448" /LENGTH=33 /DNA_ID= /DNA_START= /DNA_END= /DNA_ORIENTATION=
MMTMLEAFRPTSDGQCLPWSKSTLATASASLAK